MKLAIVNILLDEGYIEKYDLIEDGVFKTIHITLKYGADKTRPYIVPGDDRYERAQAQLEKQKETFSVSDAFHILKSVRQEGLWATRVTFVYSVMEKKIYYVLNNDFEEMSEYSFDT